MSTYTIEKSINDAVVAEAESYAAASGYDTRNFYTLQVDDQGNVDLVTVDETVVTIDETNTTDAKYRNPVKDGYHGYLVGDGVPPNGVPYGFGIRFPENAAEGDYFLRTDYLPNRLFRFDSTRWVKYEDKVRMTMTMTDDRQTQKTSYVNNRQNSNFKSLHTDTFVIKNPTVFRAEDLTSSVDLVAKKIVTRIDYDQKYGVEAFSDQQFLSVTSVINQGGKLAFIYSGELRTNDTITWTIYGQKIPQRVALSSALRPKADL